MSANLYRDTMASHGVLPWHQMGTHFEEPMTTEEAIADAFKQKAMEAAFALVTR